MSIIPEQPFDERLDFERLRAGRPEFTTPGPSPLHDALPSFLGRVVTVQSIIKSGRFVKVAPAILLGKEGEGGSGTFSDAGTGINAPSLLVYLLGSFVPTTGDYLVCRFVDHRWVAETTGGKVTPGTGILLPSCFCMVPPTLQMVSSYPDCNYKMFQTCTIQYGPPPPAMVAQNFTSNVFTSTSSFVDPITKSSFFYYFWCQYNQFFLTRIFPTSPFGSPYRDAILYSWVVGGYANTCQPFRLENGAPFPGSDTACQVSIIGG